MVNLTHVGDEDVEQIFLVIEGLKDGLSGGFQDNKLYDKAVAIQRSCIRALARGSDNDAVVERLEEMIAYEIHDW